MRVHDDLLVLTLEADLMGGKALIHPALILDADAGPTLVDAGLPGMEGALNAALAESGLSLADLRRVIVTHHDLDHIGALPAVVAASGAEVWALDREVPYLDGRERPQKMPPPERAQALLADPQTPPHLRAFLSAPRVTVQVDRALHDGEELPLAGGVRVVATPGHTHGHLSLYLERSRTLIAGDALGSENGQLRAPFGAGTADMVTAGHSVRKVAGLDVQTILTYHGGVVREDAGGQLRRVSEQMAAQQQQ